MDNKKIFISGPKDVNSICNALSAYLIEMRYVPIRMPLPECNKPPVDVSIKELRKCDAMVLILSTEIGDTSHNRAPITILEYEEAMNEGIPVFAYIDNIEDDKKKEMEPELSHFIENIKNEITYNDTFTFSKNQAEMCQRVYEIIREYSWIPKCFTSFIGWKHILSSTYFARMRNAEHGDIPKRIGRNDEINILTEWIKQKGSKLDIFAVSGKTGYGKSLLAYHFVEEIRNNLVREDDVMILLKGSNVEPDKIREITPEKLGQRPVLIIIEDAGSQEGSVVKLIQYITSRSDSDRFKILLCVQEQYLNDILTACDPFIETANNKINLLNFDFSKDDIKNSINEILKPHSIKLDASHFDTLQRETSGVPYFVDVVISHIKSGDDLKQIDKDKIFNYMMGDIGDDDLRNTMLFFSLLSPIEENGIDAIIPLIEKTADKKINKGDFEAQIDGLMRKGIIGKYGRKYKVIPEILQNIVIVKSVTKDKLKEISISLAGGLDESALERFVVNLFRSIWHDDPLIKDYEDIVKPISIYLVTALAEDNFEKAYNVLKVFANVAYYIPEYAKDIAEHVYKKYFNKEINEVVLPENPDKLWGKYQYEMEIEKAAEIAYWTALSTRDADTRKRMFQILWDLGKNNEKETSSWPEHPMRRLEDLAEFKHFRFSDEDKKFYSLLLDCVSEWLKEYQGAKVPTKTPIRIFDKILDWQWENTSPIKSGIMLRHGYLAYDTKLEEIKIRAVELLVNSFKNSALLKHTDYFQAGLRHIRGILPYYADKDRKKWTALSEKGLDELVNLIKYYMDGNKPVHAFRVICEFNDYLERIKEYPGWEDIGKKIEKAEQEFRQKFPEGYQMLDTLSGESFVKTPDENKIKELAKTLLNAKAEENFEFLENLHKEVDDINWSIFNISLATIKLENDLQKKWVERCLELAELICKKSESGILSGAGPHFLTNIRKYLVENIDDGLKQRYIGSLGKYIKKIENGTDHLKGYIQHELKRFFWFLIRDVSNISLFDEEKTIIKSWEYEPGHTIAFILDELSKTDIELAKSIALNLNTGNDQKKADEKCGTIMMRSGRIRDSIREDEFKKLLDELIDVPEISHHGGYHIQQLIVFYSNKNNNYADMIFGFFLRRLGKYERKYSEDEKHEYKPTPAFLSEHDFQGIFSKLDIETRKKYLRSVVEIVNENKKTYEYINYDVHLFNIFANNYSNDELNKNIVMPVMEEWAISNDYNKLYMIARFIAHSYDTFVFDYPKLVREILVNAKKLEESDQKLKAANYQLKIQSDLAASAELGVYSRTPGEPSDRYHNMETMANDIIREQGFSITDPAYKFYYGLIQCARQEMDRERLSDEEDD